MKRQSRQGRGFEGYCGAIHISGDPASCLEIEGRVIYLLDTNIFLKILLQREKSKAAKEHITTIPSTKLLMTDFSLQIGTFNGIVNSSRGHLMYFLAKVAMKAAHINVPNTVSIIATD